MLRWLLVSALLLCMACPGNKPTTGSPNDAGIQKITLFVTAELRGEIEPCGCTSDPLGDLARFAALLAEARKSGPAIWLDAGSFLYSETKLTDGKGTQERLKADLLRAQAERLGLAAAGLGAYDLADGVDDLAPPGRVVANLGDRFEPHKLIDAGGVKIGVFGLADEAVARALGAELADPVATATAQVKKLRESGAQVIVALTQLDRQQARKLARDVAGLDFVVAGKDTPDYLASSVPPGIDKSGDGFVLQPLQRGQSLVRLELHLGGPGPFTDALGETRARARIGELAQLIPQRQAKHDELKAADGADPAFLAQGQAEIDRLTAEKTELEKNPLRKPAQGSWFTGAHVLVKKQLPCDAELVKAKKEFDMAAAAKNLEAAKAEKPVPVPAGGAGYVGDEECGFCHAPAVEFWKKTKHAAAWQTIVDVGKSANRDCVSCHVTGWMEPGGATLAANETLRNVQCEACHGPGSKHVDSDGKALDSLVKTTPKDRCVTCHQFAHSDTFDYEPYLRDVTGPGHGEKLRAKLGEGTTGRALRSAALAKAGAGIGANCPK